jgi:hypothetical protein
MTPQNIPARRNAENRQWRRWCLRAASGCALSLGRKWAQLRTTANPDKNLGKERRVHAAAWQKESLCRLKPAFLDSDAKLHPGRNFPL